jgi:hypothetical protein
LATNRTETEPTVLDWFISLVRLRPIPIPEPGAQSATPIPLPTAKEKSAPDGAAVRVQVQHIRVPAAVLIAVVAQIGLSSHSNVPIFVGLYLAAAVLVGWGVWAGDFGKVVMASTRRKSAVAVVDRRLLVAGLGLAILTFITSADNTFRLITVVFWIASVLVVGGSFWLGDLPGSKLLARFRDFASKPQLRLRLDGWSLLVLAAFGLATYFRFSQLSDVPFGMWSDHAEKYLDIVDVLEGKTAIFFPRNTGREPAQFYMAAAAIKWFGADFSFLTLKSITAFVGWLSLPFIYFFGRQVGGREVGLFAMLLAGIAFWPNLVARIGLRHVFHYTFVAAAMFFMLRGFKLRKQNDFVLTGVFVGLGVYGYTASRLIPLIIGLGLAVYLVHRISRGHRIQSMTWVGVAALVSIVVAVPLLRVAFELPDDVMYRSLTRISNTEQALLGPPLQLFLGNMWNALRIFTWDFGQIWILALPNRPALDWVTGALFHFGLVLVFVRYLKGRDWVDLFLLMSIPVLLLPSVLSLAFPAENPHPSRAAGAIVPVFTIAGIAAVSIWNWSQREFEIPWSKRIGVWLVGGMMLVAAAINYEMAIGEYGDIERNNSWNTAQAAEVVESFTTSIGSFEDVHMIAYRHWMDTRLVALLAGQPGQDIVLWPDQIEGLPEVNTPQLFMLHPSDEEGLNRLSEKFPGGITNRHVAEVEGRDFITYLVLEGES